MKKITFVTLLLAVSVFTKMSAQNCNPITGLTVSNITDTNATFDWNLTAPFTGYNLSYRPSYSNTWIWIGGGTVNHQTLSVFSPGTTYEFEVSGVLMYGSGGCPPAYITFTTTDTVAPPPETSPKVKGRKKRKQ